MVSAGIPELAELEDVEYLRAMLLEETDDVKSSQRLREEILKSVSTKWRQIDNLIHTWVHEA
jgi:hypothetical protein